MQEHYQNNCIRRIVEQCGAVLCVPLLRLHTATTLMAMINRRNEECCALLATRTRHGDGVKSSVGPRIHTPLTMAPMIQLPLRSTRTGEHKHIQWSAFERTRAKATGLIIS